ncbi:restriction endonuclease subunit S [Acidisoma sp. 7E03]
MSAVWPTVALGEVIDHRKEFIIIDDLETYRRPRVQLHAQGIVLRDAVPGAEIRTKKQQVARAGEFLVAEIDAKVGGFGIVPDELDGSIVSSHYFLYEHNPVRLDNRYLGWFVKTRAFRQQVEAQGSTNYAAIRPNDVLSYEIPLPPLDEQRRIVAHIEELAAKVAKARAYRAQATKQREGFIESFIGQRFAELEAIYPDRTFGSCDAHVSSGPRNWGKNYAPSGLRFYRAQDISRDFQISNEGIVYVERPPGSQGQSAIVSNGDLLIVITGATVGRVAVYDDTYSPGLVSQHVAVCRIPPASFLPRFALWGLRGPNGQKQLLGSKYGQGKPGLNLDQVRRLSLPCPPIDVQAKIVGELDAFQSKLDEVEARQTETATELDAMLPAILDKAFKGEL